MKKSTVKLNEAQLRKIVAESVKKVLNEIEVIPKKDDKYGTRKWLDKEYGEYNGKIPKDWLTTNSLIKTHNKGYNDNDFKGVSKAKRDANGYDKEGYDREGYDKDGFGRKGFDREGFNRRGYDKEGYNRKGFNRYGIDREGFNTKGFNKSGVDRNGLDKNGKMGINTIKEIVNDYVNNKFNEIMNTILGGAGEGRSFRELIEQLHKNGFAFTSLLSLAMAKSVARNHAAKIVKDSLSSISEDKRKVNYVEKLIYNKILEYLTLLDED